MIKTPKSTSDVLPEIHCQSHGVIGSRDGSCPECPQGEMLRHGFQSATPAIELQRESVDEVLETVGTFGPWGTDIREELRWLIVLADEVKRLRIARDAFSNDATELQHELDVLRSAPSNS